MIGDCMMFPDTAEEFIEEYSFVDEKEVYTNGSELIAVFRVKQMMEHYIGVVHAHWILENYSDDFVTCSHCGGNVGRRYPNCPHCRAVMDEVRVRSIYDEDKPL